MDTERNLGPQPISDIMAAHELTPHALVEASTEQLTHKMVNRATKGRRLTANTKAKVIKAINAATGKSYAAGELFNY